LPILESIHLLELEESWLGEAADPKQYAKIILERLEQQPDGAEHAAEGQGLGEIAANAHAVMAGELPEFITEHSELLREMDRQNARFRQEREEERKREREREEKDKKQQEENERQQREIEALKRRLHIFEVQHGEAHTAESKTTGRETNIGPTTRAASAFQKTQRHSRFHQQAAPASETKCVDESPRPQRFMYPRQQGSSR